MSRRNGIIVKKLRNILILLMAIIVMIGAYKNIGDSRAEDVIEIDAIAIDNYGYLENELFKLEAIHIGKDRYQIEMPESINGKIINKIVKVTLEEPTTETESENAVQENASAPEENETTQENTTDVDKNTTSETTTDNVTTETQEEETPVEENTVENNDVTQEPEIVEVVGNKIYLTKEQIESKELNIEVAYEIVLLEKNEQGEINKSFLSSKTEEERNQLKETQESEMIYSKILKYEDEENGKLVEVKGLLPKDAELKVEEVSQEQLKEIFGDAQIDVAYDIKIVLQETKEVLIDETDPTKGTTEIIETIEVNPEEFGELCEVSIKDANILENSQVYHVKEDNTYEQVNVKNNTEESITFDAPSFSIYAVSADEGIMTLAGGFFDACSIYCSPGSDYSWSQFKTVNLKVTGTGLSSLDAKFSWKSYASSGGTGAHEGLISSSYDAWEWKYTSNARREGVFYLGYTVSGTNWDGDDDTFSSQSGPYYIDYVGPSAPSISNPYAGTWTNQNVTVTASSTDGGSGVSYYQWSYDNSNWNNMSGNTVTFTDEIDSTIYIRAVDAVGNVSDASSTSVHIDKTMPTGTISASAFHTNQDTVTIYVTDVHDFGGSDVNALWIDAYYTYNYSYTAHCTTFGLSWDSTNNRWYVNVSLNDIKNTVTGETNQGEGYYSFDLKLRRLCRKSRLGWCCWCNV